MDGVGSLAVGHEVNRGTLGVAVVLSFFVPGLGLYYAGLRPRAYLPWFAGSIVITTLLAIYSDNPLAATLSFVYYGVVSMLYVRLRLRKLSFELGPERRFSALSFIVPGLGHFIAKRRLDGILWFTGWIGLGLVWNTVSANNSVLLLVPLMLVVAYPFASGWSAYQGYRDPKAS